MPEQWAVYMTRFDPVEGSEQGGTRPALIVSNDDYNELTENITVVAMTSKKRKLRPSEVILPAGVAGQPLDSIVLAHQIRTISKDRLVKRIGFLRDSDIKAQIQQAIEDHLDIIRD